MPYQELDSFEKAWIFKRKDPLICAEDLKEIQPLDIPSANQVWRDYISADQLHPDHLTAQDWPKSEAAKHGTVHWESRWDSDDVNLPESILQHVEHWQDETRVYFCYHSEQVVETSFSVFSRAWKNFLFFDNGPILVAKKKKQAIQFFSTGECHLLKRL